MLTVILIIVATIYTIVFFTWAGAALLDWLDYKDPEAAKLFLLTPIWHIIAINYLTKTIKEMRTQINQDTDRPVI